MQIVSLIYFRSIFWLFWCFPVLRRNYCGILEHIERMEKLLEPIYTEISLRLLFQVSLTLNWKTIRKWNRRFLHFLLLFFKFLRYKVLAVFIWSYCFVYFVELYLVWTFDVVNILFDLIYLRSNIVLYCAQFVTNSV